MTFKEWLKENERDYLEFPEEVIALWLYEALEDAWDAGYKAGKAQESYVGERLEKL